MIWIVLHLALAMWCMYLLAGLAFCGGVVLVDAWSGAPLGWGSVRQQAATAVAVILLWPKALWWLGRELAAERERRQR